MIAKGFGKYRGIYYYIYEGFFMIPIYGGESKIVRSKDELRKEIDLMILEGF